VKIRAALHLDGQTTNLLVYPGLNETTDHQLLKLAAAVLFHRLEPMLSPSSQHPALRDQDFLPDLMKVNDENEVTLWLECGKTTIHKIEKVSKRFRGARMVMLTTQAREARQMAEEIGDENWNRLELLAFPEGEFNRWRQLITENVDLIGEADERHLNLVVNEDMYVVDLEKIT
jgi:uncharacterized protein YaeQ